MKVHPLEMCCPDWREEEGPVSNGHTTLDETGPPVTTPVTDIFIYRQSTISLKEPQGPRLGVRVHHHYSAPDETSPKTRWALVLDLAYEAVLLLHHHQDHHNGVFLPESHYCTFLTTQIT